MGPNTAKDFTNFQMGRHMKATLSKTCFKEKEFLLFQEGSTKAHLYRGEWKEEAYSNGKMAQYTKDNIKTTASMAVENTLISKVNHLRVIGKMEFGRGMATLLMNLEK
jgi:hypothetical protein